MKFSEHWLRSFVDPALTTRELAHTLTMAGLEVETIEPVAPSFDKVVVGEVLEVAKHPDADRLSLCRVNVGAGAPLEIVCGAPNVAVGMKAPVALVGARLPGIEIKRAKVRGVESNGMLCSAKELGLSDDHSGLLALPADATVGEDFRKLFDLDDHLLTLKLTPNRGDCLSLRGIAREVSILTGAKLAFASTTTVKTEFTDKRGIHLRDPLACPRYCGSIIRGVNASASTPGWMVRHIERSGLRSISAIVDITNFVMLELGQPLHAFDNRMIAGDIVVRLAQAGERLKLLNGQDVVLSPDVLLIADEKKPLALGGVMGGDESAVTDATTEVFLEAAYFNPSAIAGRARRLGLTSDAAHRFERGVDFAITLEAIARATELIISICGGSAGPVSEAAAALPARDPIRLRSSRVGRILGVAFSDKEIAELLHRLQFQHATHAGEFSVTPPSHRFDLMIEEDLIEELARIYGYDNIPTRPPKAELAMLPEAEQLRRIPDLKRILVEREYFEVINFSFVDAQWEQDFCGNDKPVALENPISAQMNVMRSGLAGGLIANLRFNLARKLDRVRIFELGRCFLHETGKEDIQDPSRAVAGFHQPVRLGGLAYGTVAIEQWGLPSRRVDFYDIKADVEALLLPRRAHFSPLQHPALHPGRAARIELDGSTIGWLGELHPNWQQKYELPQPPLLFELNVESFSSAAMPRNKEISKFPPVTRDLAVVVDENVPAATLLDAINSASLQVVQSIRLFDLYRGKGVEVGKKSLAFRVVMQDTARTLTDAEADAAMAQLTELLTVKFGARLRA